MGHFFFVFYLIIATIRSKKKQRMKKNSFMAKNNILVTGAHRYATSRVGRTIQFHPSIVYVHEPFNVTYPNKSFQYSFDTWFMNAKYSPDEHKIEQSFIQLFKENINPYHRALSKCRQAKHNFMNIIFSQKKQKELQWTPILNTCTIVQRIFLTNFIDYILTN